MLGPVEVHGPRGRAALSGARQRTLVAVLALHTGSVLPTERLIDVLWGDDPPRTAVKSLHSHVARVRQALADCGMPGALVTREPGYQLTADVDASRFERDVKAGRFHEGLALWRGDPLADAELFGWGVAEVDRLREVRLCALEQLWQAELDRGNHADAIGELERLLVSHPARERFVRLAMLALHRTGRHTDALETYQRLRTRLADDLGVDPSPDLMELHTAILRRDPSLEVRTVKPAELPARAGYFTARNAELAALSPDGPSVVVVCGAAGVGKTSLAVEWAHRVAERYPDGQLFVELGDRTDALAHVLHALGADQPASPGLYRSLLHGKRFLIVLDNARCARDVLPLVPGDPGNLLLVTSRDALAALNTSFAVRTVHLDVLSASDAVALLRGVIGPRVDEEPDAAAALAARCGHLPLALRIAAAKLAARPRRRIAELVAELDRADPFDVLAVDDRSVRAVFTSAYRALSPAAQRLFRLLSLHPGTFAEHLACSLGTGLDELVDAHLVSEVVSGRYRFHDLVRLFARSCGTEDVQPLLDWYLDIAFAANTVLSQTHHRVSRQSTSVPFGSDRTDVLAYLDAERDNLLPVVRLAAAHQRHAETWQLTYLLTGYFEARGNWTARVELCAVALDATRALGDPCAEAEMLRASGVAYFMTRQLDLAIEVQRKALVLVDGDPQSEGRLHNNIGNAYAELRRFTPALAAFEQAIERNQAAGDPLGVALSQRNLGYTYVRMGRTKLALPHLREALATFRASDHLRMVGATLNTLGTAHQQLGEHATALEHFGEALRIGRALGDQRFEADALADLGVTRLARGDLPAAHAAFDEALEVCRGIADRHREATVLHHLGQVGLRRGDPSSARGYLALAIEVHPDPFEKGLAHRTSAEVEARCGRWYEAARHWASAVDLLRAARLSET
ncbi:tetratricopeptide repeat protein [Lentzea tibetensis]|uniref:Tetratricopeptide repeat protein n=1 Tax=Lentzea tibetensis TaxID=2591470 RepID=A0A563EWM4_9PSEU|nr:tetratricopeptide repeat protein [Lentzea tibetensis]